MQVSSVASVDFPSNSGEQIGVENYGLPMTARSTMTSYDRITVRRREADPRAAALESDVRNLGIATRVGVTISDVVYFSGELGADERRTLDELLVDPLLDIGEWGGEAGEDGSTTRHVVETALLPGVTDAVAAEIMRVAERAQISLAAVATGHRFVLEGDLGAEDVRRITESLLANPVIERWSINEPLLPTFIETDAHVRSAPREMAAFHSASTLDELKEINRERGLALDPRELEAVRDHFAALGRLPTDVEVETIAQTWSEHCAHKTFRARITLDGERLPTTLLGALRESTTKIGRDFVLSAFDGNAGVVSFDGRTSYAVKCETHNHPSAIEPFGGANTGVGGVIRDVIGMAHRPIAVTDVLCFGYPDTEFDRLPDGALHPRRIRDGVVAGVADYGNKIGLPTVVGAVLYDDGYLANPLVFAGCIGIADAWNPLDAPHPGDRCIVIGGRTGRDGIRGATFSSMAMDASTGDVAGASVQIGDPIVEKLVLDALDDARHLYRSITDCGAGGLSSAIGEMADGVGADVELDLVPTKYPGLAPWEVWLSEAQERMVVACDPDVVAEFIERCVRHGIDATDIGTFMGDGVLRVRSGGMVVAEIDTGFLHDGRPQREMSAVSPRPDRNDREDVPVAIARMGVIELLVAMFEHPNGTSRADIVRRFDHEIRGATLQRPLVGVHGDAPGDGVVLCEQGADRGIAVGIGMAPLAGVSDPQRMARLAVDEAIRNVVAVGGDPDRVALMDNFSWGDPRRPESLGALVAAVQGCIEAADLHAAPFVSGKDSLNNEWLDRDGVRRAVPPTLVITAIADVADVRRVVGSDVQDAGHIVVTVGDVSACWAGTHAVTVTGASARVVPAPDAAVARRYALIHALIGAGTIVACHDISDGGMAMALAEMLLGGDLGARCNAAPTGIDERVWWFSEGPGRFLLEIDPVDLDRVRDAFVDVHVVATLTTQRDLAFSDGASVSLDDVRTARSPR